MLLAFFAALVLLVSGCGGAPQAANPGAGVEIDASEVANGKPAVDGWVPDAVKYCQEHGSDNGVLVQVTGMITEGTDKGTVETMTLCDPMEVEAKEDGEFERYEVAPGNMCAEVYFAEPVEMTKWPHLISVRGMAFLDPSQENKIVIRDAIESED